jgi:hypothetical protein
LNDIGQSLLLVWDKDSLLRDNDPGAPVTSEIRNGTWGLRETT